MVKKSNFMAIVCVFGLFITFFPANVGATITGTQPPSSGDWVINNVTVVTDESIDLNGSIIVNSGGSLTLDNSTLTINCASDGEYGIIVNSGGAIYIKNNASIDRSGLGNYYFMVRAGADFEMRNSTLKHCGYDNSVDYRYTGPYLECDGLIEYSTIDLCQQGIIAENGTVTIRYSRIEHSSWHNVEGRNANLILDQCIFNATSTKCNVEFYEGCTAICTNNIISNSGSNNIWAKINVTATIEGNTIYGAERCGIWASGNCELTIKDNIIHNNSLSGIWIQDGSDVECYGNTIEWNGDTEAQYWNNSGHGFAGYDSEVYFHNNTVSYNYGHNFETTRCTAVFEDNHFDASLMKCNVEFFDHSDVTARRNYIDGAGHNCFWVRDGVTALIEGNTMKNSPHNGIWAGNGCTMTIKDNIIDTMVEHGIYSYNSTLTITNNDIRNCGEWGIYTEGCTVIKSGNTFAAVADGNICNLYFITIEAKDKDGVAIEGASVTVKDSAGNDIWTTTTDANGQTTPILLKGSQVDTSGASTTLSYTIEAEKDDLKGTSTLTPDQTETATLSLEAEADGDDDDEDGLGLMPMIAIILIIVVVVILVAVLAKKKPGEPKEAGEPEGTEKTEEEQPEKVEKTEEETEADESEEAEEIEESKEPE